MGEKREAVRVWMLGGFRVSVGSRTITQDAWHLRKAATLVKVLALSPGHRMHREQAMDLLWPDLGRRAASNNLRQALYTARGTLDPAAGSRYLASQDESLVLHPGGDLWVDVEAFEEATATARRARDPVAYRAALELYADELLPGDRYEEWAEGRRQELRHTWLSLHLELARVYEERGEYEKGIELLQRALLEEPTNEQMHACLMRLYAFSEQQGEALAQYQRLREALSGELDAELSTTTLQLREEIAAGRLLPAQPAGRPSDDPSDTGKHNLPASRTSFVGREHEIIEIKRHLAMTRLLTLTGAGGSGKTRLALEVARELVGAYPDGMWLAEFASLSQGEFVAQSVAEAVGVPGQPDRPLTDTLVDALRTKNMLLILDNCEHLIDAVGDLVALLLDSCPRLRILATSREALGAVGEVIWPVSLLSVPGPKRLPTVAQLEGYEAIRLFVDRARQRNPAFTLRAENAQAVAHICAHLEGLPLAIELAAARIKILPPQALLGRLKDRLKLLSGGPRELSERQRTLRSTIEWSYELLEEDEKALFRRLSVFSGGATLEAIEAVCDALGDLSVDAFEGASSLLEKSLLGQEEGTGGESRLVMLETIREYAREKLGRSGDAHEIKRAHAEYFLALAEEAEPELKGPEQKAWLERLEADHDNMRAAIAWSLEGGEEPGLGLRIAGALWWFWFLRGHVQEGIGWLERALARGNYSASPSARAKALHGMAFLLEGQGDYERAMSLYEVGLSMYRQAEDEAGIAFVTCTMANLATLRGEHQKAVELNEKSLALSRKVGDQWLAAYALHNLGVEAAEGQGDYGRARALLGDALALARRVRDQQLISICLTDLGITAMYTGEEEAESLFQEAVVLQRELGQKENIAAALRVLGLVRMNRGDHERARALLKESLALSKELGHKLYAAAALNAAASVAVSRGEVERAARLFGAAEMLHEAIGSPLPPSERALFEPHLAIARSWLGEATWERVWEEGRAMTLEEAVSYALEEEDTDPLTTSVPGEPSAGQPHVTLSRREEEVAALVAQGMSNRQIAQELFLSERTIENHVSKILRKLELTSRTEIASWATQQRLLAPNPD
jgi:predicted ATPase/DNA-binding SARP family transcriptional activator/DNA-binding CsgD family transcriptional regulator